MSAPSTIVVGTGIIGIATAYFLARNHGQTRITLIDRDQPMSFTSAQSGENYRNWWPHPAMVAFTNRSIDLRGAARLTPALKTYYGHLPRNTHHYGGWYTMTEENWPLIGPIGPEGAFVNCAYSGFGTMVACAGGELCAATIAGAELPDYARGFSLARYGDAELMAALRAANKGVL